MKKTKKAAPKEKVVITGKLVVTGENVLAPGPTWKIDSDRVSEVSHCTITTEEHVRRALRCAWTAPDQIRATLAHWSVRWNPLAWKLRRSLRGALVSMDSSEPLFDLAKDYKYKAPPDMDNAFLSVVEAANAAHEAWNRIEIERTPEGIKWRKVPR